MARLFWVLLARSYWLGIFLFLPAAQAQVSPDASGVGSIVEITGSDATIKGGSERGRNLFHSFSEFSLTPSTIRSVTFDNATGIENIITRVTGGSISNINGLIQAQGEANLFFLNPNGIVFGDQATLRLGGSFVASTANSIKFGDSTEFSAVNPTPPLLTISQPIALQYGATPGKIRVEAIGHFIFVNPDPFEIVRFYRPAGLEVRPGKTLALMGGNVEIQGGNLTSEQGQIEIGAIANSTVSLTPTSSGWDFSYPTNASFQDVTFSQGGSADTSGNGGGKIRVQARQINVLDGSALLSLTLGDGSAGQLDLKASESVTVRGEFVYQDYPYFPSSLLTEVGLGASGQGGSLSVRTGNFLAAEGAKISTSTSGSGDSGLMLIEANAIDVQGGSPNFGATLLSAGAKFEGDGGLIRLNADTIRFTEGGAIASTTSQSGDAGSVEIQANNVNILGNPPEYGASGIFLSTLSGSSGDAGELTVKASTIEISGGGSIASVTGGSGKAGSVEIQAQTVDLRGGSPNGISAITLVTLPGSSGRGGDFTLTADQFQILDGAQLIGDTSGSGNAGVFTLRTGTSKVAGQYDADFYSNLSTQTRVGATGNGGAINITTNQLLVSNGGTIAATTNGEGKGGSILIRAGSIELQGAPLPSPTGILTTVNPGATGEGGILTIEAQRLGIFNGAQIGAGTFGSGNGNTLSVTASEIELAGSVPQGRSGLFANAIAGTGAGGDIFVKSDRLLIRDGATINASNFTSRNQAPPGQGAAGSIDVQAGTIKLDQGSITTSTVTGGRGSIHLRSQLLSLLNESAITTNSQGLEPGGNIEINTQFLVGYRNSDLTANAVNARGGRVMVNAEGIFGLAVRDRLTPKSDMTASSDLGVAFNGTIEINANVDPARGLAKLPDGIANEDQRVAASCGLPSGNQFVVTGRGGLPEDASQDLRGGAVWQDLRIAEDAVVDRTSKPIQTSVVPEAQSWIVRSDGQVELVAEAPVTAQSMNCAVQNY